MCVAHPHADESRGLRTRAAQAEAVALTAAQWVGVSEAERAHLTAVAAHALHIGLKHTHISAHLTISVNYTQINTTS